MAGADNLTPWQPGQSGNPKGKPKGTIHLSTRIQKILNDPEFTTKLVTPDGKTIDFKGEPMDAILTTAVLKSMSGDHKWAKWLAENGYGKWQKHEFEASPIDQILEKYGLKESEDKNGEDTPDAGQTKST